MSDAPVPLSNDFSERVRVLITELRLKTSPDAPSPEDVCRYVALHLDVSEASARDLILRAALQNAERGLHGKPRWV